MQLTERQIDTLTELINIAFSRTAASLSELAGNRVLLEAPQVALLPLTNLTTMLAGVVNGEIATVHQVFSGPVAGDAFLLLNYDGAVLLSELLAGGTASPQRLNASTAEVLAEVGNILLNACLGIFGNLLQVYVSFSVPRLHLESLDGLLNSLVVGNSELRYGLVAYTAFHVQNSKVNGYLVIVLGVASLEHLIDSLDQLG